MTENDLDALVEDQDFRRKLRNIQAKALMSETAGYNRSTLDPDLDMAADLLASHYINDKYHADESWMRDFEHDLGSALHALSREYAQDDPLWAQQALAAAGIIFQHIPDIYSVQRVMNDIHILNSDHRHNTIASLLYQPLLYFLHPEERCGDLETIPHSYGPFLNIQAGDFDMTPEQAAQSRGQARMAMAIHHVHRLSITPVAHREFDFERGRESGPTVNKVVRYAKSGCDDLLATSLTDKSTGRLSCGIALQSAYYINRYSGLGFGYNC